MENSNQFRQNVNFLQGAGNLIKLLPTGTVFLYQLISPVTTNYGHCQGHHDAHFILSAIFVGVCGLICFFASFTDSYEVENNQIVYGLVTPWGLYPAAPQHNANYRLRFGDFVHAGLAVVVFAMVVLFDNNFVNCFFPTSFEKSQKTLLMVLPASIGFVSSAGLAVSIPTRNWFGYPSHHKPQNVPNPVAVEGGN